MQDIDSEPLVRKSAMTQQRRRDESISNIRFICIFLMTFAHDPFALNLIDFQSALPYAAAHSPIAYLNYIFAFGLSRISSPVLGFFSGYFVSANLIDRPYLRIVQAKLKLLYIPAILWSLVFFIVTIAAGYAASNHAAVHERLATVDLNDFLGITHFPLNYPLHYLIALFKCILISPILIYMLRRFGPVCFVVSVTLIFLALTGSDLNPAQPGQHAHDIWPRADLFLFFSLGLLAQRRWNLEIGETLGRFQIGNPVVLSAIAVLFLLGTFNWSWFVKQGGLGHVWFGAFVLLTVRATGTLLLLALLPWLRKMAQRGFYVSDRLTFTLFCTHLISFFVLERIIGLAHLSAYGALEFYLAPIFATGVAAGILFAQKRANAAFRYWRPVHESR